MIGPEEIAMSVLEEGYLASLATVDEHGPWACDIVYVADANFGIYWISDADARHSKDIALNPEVAVVVTTSDRYGMPNQSVQIEGEAERLEGDVLPMAIKMNEKKRKPLPTAEGEILEEETRKYGKRHFWYRLKPKKVCLQYQPIFGLEKQVFYPGNAGSG